MTQDQLNELLIEGVESGRLMAMKSADGEAKFYLPHQVPAEAIEQALTADDLRSDLKRSGVAEWN